MVDWVRLWHDMPTDPKWRVISKKSGQPIAVVIAVYNFLLVNASANATERGRTHNFSCEDVAAALDMDEAEIAAVIDAMQGKVLDGERLTGWEKRQPKREDNSAERAKAWRERNRTQPNATERPDTDTDTDNISPLPPLGEDAVFEEWDRQAATSGLPKVRVKSTARRKALQARIREHGLENVLLAVRKIHASGHCRGENERGWKADFEFLLQAKSCRRAIEGGYDNRAREGPGKVLPGFR